VLLIDTDVLVWYMRGNERASSRIDKHEPFSISAVTYMELVQGMRNKTEFNRFRKMILSKDVRIVQINEEISSRAAYYVEEYYLSHSLQIADALIASTAVDNGLKLLTGNAKHFRVIKDLDVQNFVP
jgi:predicted nucleic acid-binding protein